MTCAILLLSAIVGGPTPSPAPRSESASHARVRFDRGHSTGRMPVEIAGDGLAFVKGKAGDADVWLLLDTASPSVLSRKIAEKLGLSPSGDPLASGAEESLPATRTLSQVTIRLPGMELTQPSVSSFDLDGFQTALGHKVDGILGAPFFESVVVELDYARATVALSDPKTYRYPGRAGAVGVRLEAGYPYIEGHLAVPGKPPFAGSFLIDTGVDNAVILFSPFVASRGLLGAAKITPEAGPSAGGGSLEAIFRAERLELGPFVFREPVVQLSRSTKGLLADSKHAGLIGGAVLSRFRVTADLPHGRLFLEKNRRYEEPFLHDASGLSLVAQGPDLTTFLIRRVSPGSPGAQAGLVAGDVIVAVDGKPAKDVTLRGLRRLLQQGGKTYVLSVFREGEIQKFTIECRRQL